MQIQKHLRQSSGTIDSRACDAVMHHTAHDRHIGTSAQQCMLKARPFCSSVPARLEQQRCKGCCAHDRHTTHPTCGQRARVQLSPRPPLCCRSQVRRQPPAHEVGHSIAGTALAGNKLLLCAEMAIFRFALNVMSIGNLVSSAPSQLC